MEIPVHMILRNIASMGKEYADEIDNWLDGSEDNRKLYDDLVRVWQISGTFPSRFSPVKDVAWKKVHHQIQKRSQKSLLVKKLIQYAAAVVVVLLSVWSGALLDQRNLKNQITEVISPAGHKTRILLPDSSVVMLNSDSKIRYNQRFNNSDRKVELIGEGYFEIRKDHSRQFIVHAQGLDIKVFGTSFNVKAYGEDKSVEIGLKNGSIGIEQNGDEISRLVPGQMATLNKQNHKLAVTNRDINVVSAWTREEMIFNEQTLGDIINYVERWYGVTIQVAPELLDGELLTFKVKTESLNELLNLISMIKPIKYTIDGKLVVISKR